MLTSIKKTTKSFLAKVLIFIIILPFLFWGMGDVFRGGNQNILATIDSEKISVQKFEEYVNRLNLSEEQRVNLKKKDLLNKILYDYVGKKIIELEIKDQGISLSNLSLKKFITNDEIFQKDKKFVRTLYEKFLLESGISAPVFEKNIAEQEKKRQLLTFLSEGIILPASLIQKEFESENQIKIIQYLELDEFYKKNKIKDEEIKKTYESNKKLFVQEFKKINYIELLPSSLTGQTEYNETYFGKLDDIENSILDGVKMNSFVKEFNLSLEEINETNRFKKNKAGKDIKKINDILFSRLFSSSIINKPELINIKNKYYLSEVVKIEKINRSLDDVKIKESIIAQLKIKNVIESNTDIVRKMSEGKFEKEQFDKFSKDSGVIIKKITLQNIKDESIFGKDIIKEIFKIKDDEMQLVTDSSFSKNYIIFSEKTRKLPFSENTKDYEKYKSKAKLSLANQIYSTFDKTMNDRYKVDINQKVLSRVKNTL